MVHQLVVSRRESLRAEATFVGFFSGVDHFVLSFFAVGAEALVAEIANVGSVVGVDPGVAFQRRLHVESLVTVFALEAALVCVHSHMVD